MPITTAFAIQIPVISRPLSQMEMSILLHHWQDIKFNCKIYKNLSFMITAINHIQFITSCPVGNVRDNVVVSPWNVTLQTTLFRLLRLWSVLEAFNDQSIQIWLKTGQHIQAEWELGAKWACQGWTDRLINPYIVGIVMKAEHKEIPPRI